MNVFVLATLDLLAMLAQPQPAQAAYPDHPVRIVVAFAPGSSTDTVARLIAERLQATLGQAAVVENKPGAGGNIATQAVMAAPAEATPCCSTAWLTPSIPRCLPMPATTRYRICSPWRWPPSHPT